MGRISIIAIFFWLSSIAAQAQCGSSDFSVPSGNCLNEKISLTPSDLTLSEYQWDFCPGDLDKIPSASVLINSSSIGGPYKVKVMEDGGNFYGFFTSRSSQKLFRLNFGADITSQPTLTDLGSLGVGSSGWLTIDIVNESGIYYGFVIDVTNKVYRTRIGSSLSGQPENGELLYSAGLLNLPIDLTVLEDASGKYAFVANYNINKITRLKFNQGFTSAMSDLTIDNIVVTGSGGIAGISFLQHCSVWHAIATSANGTISKIDFTTDLADPDPDIHQLSGFGFTPSQPAGVSLATDNGNYYAFIQSLSSSNLYRLDFGTTLANNSPSGTDLGNFGLLSGVWAYSMFKAKSNWLGLASENGGSRIFRVNFPNTCFVAPEFSNASKPEITSESAGSFSISLTTKDGSGVFSTTSKVMEIENAPSPQISFDHQNSCAENDVHFNSIVASGTITDFTWSFGDASVSTDPNPTHQYSLSDDYDVKLDVRDANGCKNTVQKTIKIYDAPVASFSQPAGLLCTNNDLMFLNTTTDNFDGNLTYQWYSDDILVSTSRDLQLNLASTGIKAIKLRTSIPGCAHETIQNTSPVKAGPVVEFSFAGVCEQDDVQFTSIITDAVDSQIWDFADGNSSAEINPRHTFLDDGTYDVSLTALSPNGCANIKRKVITINEKPQPDFVLDGPPSSCSGNPSNFIDLTPDLSHVSLESWQWTFSTGETSSDQNPAHIFQRAGQYNVKLIVTSAQGCSNSITKPVTILQSPTIKFDNGATCVNKQVNFNASSDNAIHYYWEIGTAYYESQNISHTFTTPGSHPVKVSVIGDNDCITTVTRTVNVPVPLVPAFAYTNNCKDFETRFTSTSSSSDPVVKSLWNFGGEGTSSGVNPTFKFSSVGSKVVTLEVTTASGCVYQRQDAVNIIHPPQAAFSFAPGFGVPPQEISFMNASKNANSFNWNFGDGASSSEASPKHTFTELGDYTVALSASNHAGCETSTSKVISMVAPLPDVDLNLMTITPNNDGTWRVIVTIENKGNTFLRNLPVRLDVSGEVTLETVVDEVIEPFSQHNLVLNFGIAKSSRLEFLCASALLNGDLNPQGNRICEQLQPEMVIIAPHPNPVTDFLNIEWVAQAGEEVELQLVDSFGKVVLSQVSASTHGLNQYHLDVRDLRPGIYIFRIVGERHSESHRIVVSNQN